MVESIIKLKPKDELQPKLKIQLKLKLKIQLQPKLKIQLQPKLKIQLKLKLKPESVPKLKPESVPKLKIKLKLKLKPASNMVDFLYEYNVINIIKCQSIIKSWLARKYLVKMKIQKLFDTNVKGKPINVENIHDCSEGHWLETNMGLKPNNFNKPDILGFEMKKMSQKITFGDIVATEYIYSTKCNYIQIKSDQIKTRDDFLKIFGTPKDHNGELRYSWSGMCIPKYNIYNKYGQILIVDHYNNIIIKYNYLLDQRMDKFDIIPRSLQTGEIVLAVWKHEIMRAKIEDKFNCGGFFICKKVGNTYNSIDFGRKFNYNSFIKGIKSADIFFDSGMHQGNSRNYSQWRANKNYWETLLLPKSVISTIE
jgi:hypothetical protein